MKFKIGYEIMPTIPRFEFDMIEVEVGNSKTVVYNKVDAGNFIQEIWEQQYDGDFNMLEAKIFFVYNWGNLGYDRILERRMLCVGVEENVE